MCWRLLQAPISLISNTLYVVQYNKASTFLSAGKNYGQELINTSKMLFLPALGMGIILVWKGPELFSWFLGEQWKISGIMAQFLALWFVLQFVISPFSFIAILAKRQQTALIFSVVDMLLKGLALYLGYIQSSIQLGLMYYSATSGTVLLLQFFWYHQLAAGLHTAQQPR
jgi:O-antigen/teichoic acid export membrane protein